MVTVAHALVHGIRGTVSNLLFRLYVGQEWLSLATLSTGGAPEREGEEVDWSVLYSRAHLAWITSWFFLYLTSPLCCRFTRNLHVEARDIKGSTCCSEIKKVALICKLHKNGGRNLLYPCERTRISVRGDCIKCSIEQICKVNSSCCHWWRETKYI